MINYYNLEGIVHNFAPGDLQGRAVSLHQSGFTFDPISPFMPFRG